MAPTQTVESQATHSVETPVVVDLGSAKNADIRLLEKGEGPLTDSVLTLIGQLRNDGTIAGTAQPVIVVVKRKTTRKGLISMLLEG